MGIDFLELHFSQWNIYNCLHANLRALDTQQWFWKPVDTKKVVGYLDIIKNPMDLATIREGILNNNYHSREEFLNDIRQIVKNSEIFNGENSIFTLKVKLKLHQMEYFQL